MTTIPAANLPSASDSADEPDEQENPQPLWPDIVSLEDSATTAPEAEQGSQEPEIELPDELPILPLKDTVVYPFAVMPLGVGKERSIRLIDEIMRGDRGWSASWRRRTKTSRRPRRGLLPRRHGRAHRPTAAHSRRHDADHRAGAGAHSHRRVVPPRSHS